MIFIFHERVASTILLALQRLERRLHMDHPHYDAVKSALYNAQSGQGGEKYIDSTLSAIHIPIPHMIYPNFRLYEKYIPSTQIDILIFTSAYALVVEVKNWGGTITLQNTGQAIQEKNGVVRSMDCPIVQAEYYRENLLDWFHMNDIALPVHRVVIFPFASTLLIGAENRGVHFTKELPQIIRKLNKLPLQLHLNDFKSLSKKLQASNNPFARVDICEQYGILPSDLMKGFYCPHCHIQLHKKNSRHYVCPLCSSVPENPIHEIMIDWFTLFGDHVTNKDIRDLSGMGDSHRVHYFMKKSGFPSSGRNKGTVYHVNEKEKHQFLLKRINKVSK